jgi:hypothetical protein
MPLDGSVPDGHLDRFAVVFLGAFVVTGVVVLVHRKILPALGIWIGTEGPPSGTSG